MTNSTERQEDKVVAYLAPCFFCRERAVSLTKYECDAPDFMFIKEDGAYLMHHNCASLAFVGPPKGAA